MYAFIVDLTHFMRTGDIKYFLVFFLAIWLRWFIVSLRALRYRPCSSSFTAKTSVIIPVLDEPPELFSKVLDSIVAQKPYEVIVVINGKRNLKLENVCKKFSVKYLWEKKSGKRNAIMVGVGNSSGLITALVDSDTIWAENTLTELVRPFRDKAIGGVTTRQLINNPKGVLGRFCDWLENIRYFGTMSAMSVRGKVGCLPGRTIAFRKEILDKVMDEFMNETFLGFHKEVSDDRSLTNLTLKLGYKTVMQDTSVVYTESPETWRKFIKQQLRWAEGSQYNNVKMSTWMAKHSRLMFFIYWSDTLIPFLLWSTYLSLIFNILFNNSSVDMLVSWQLVPILTILGAYISYSSRQILSIRENNKHLLYIPLYILTLSFIMAPIRMIGFARLADDTSWGTRGNGYIGNKGNKLWMITFRILAILILVSFTFIGIMVG